MRQWNILIPASAIALLLIIGIAPYLSGYFTGVLLGLTGHPVTWTRWRDYVQVPDQAAYAPYAWRIYLAGGLGIGMPSVIAVVALRALRRRLPEPRPPRFEPLKAIASASRHGVVLTRNIATDMSVLVATSRPERAVLGTLLPTLEQSVGPWLLVGTPDVVASCAPAIQRRDIVHLAPFGRGHRWNPFSAAWTREGLRMPVLDSLAERWYPANDPSSRLLASHARQAFVALVQVVDDVLRANGEVIPPAPGDLHRLTEPLGTDQCRAYLDALAETEALSKRTREALRPWQSLDDVAFRLVCDALRVPLALFGHASVDAATRGDDISGRDPHRTVVFIELPPERRSEASHLVDTFIAWWRHATHGAPHRRLLIDRLDTFGRMPILLDGDLPCAATTQRLATLRSIYGRDTGKLLSHFPCLVMQKATNDTCAQEGEDLLQTYVQVHDPKGRGIGHPARAGDLRDLPDDQQLVITGPWFRPYTARLPSVRHQAITLPVQETGDAMPFPKPLVSLLTSLLAACSTPTSEAVDGKGTTSDTSIKGCNSQHNVGSVQYVDACLGPHRFRLPRNLYEWQTGQDLVGIGIGVGLNVQWPSLEPLPQGQDYHDNNETFISSIALDIQYLGPHSDSNHGIILRKSIEPFPSDDPERWNNPDDNLHLRIKGAPVYDLTPYYADFNLIELYYKNLYGELTKATDPDVHRDWFIRMTDDDLPSTVIICESHRMPDGAAIEQNRIVDKAGDFRSSCTHKFIVTKYSVIVYAHYLRIMMHDWERIEARVRSLLESSEVK
ncbi:MAG: hypothetical protein GAK28_04723 [Luteibacter sp.]|uniref:hypothetical protein n=1 Tax=Luteibacter sp. TaxID=1886636 RepID=UPI00137D0E31|nr:hypothetical protein [Luteibacter sp.]KAF1003437.1 MAG: hypothetical protein GAK28_04723 [Luteibacter sp.]